MKIGNRDPNFHAFSNNCSDGTPYGVTAVRTRNFHAFVAQISDLRRQIVFLSPATFWRQFGCRQNGGDLSGQTAFLSFDPS